MTRASPYLLRPGPPQMLLHGEPLLVRQAWGKLRR